MSALLRLEAQSLNSKKWMFVNFIPFHFHPLRAATFTHIQMRGMVVILPSTPTTTATTAATMKMNFIHVLCYLYRISSANTVDLSMLTSPSSYFSTRFVITHTRLEWENACASERAKERVSQWMSIQSTRILRACVRDNSSMLFWMYSIFRIFPLAIPIVTLTLIESLSFSAAYTTQFHWSKCACFRFAYA